jgi:uncharacterized membrane protein (GlpM family)
MKFLTITCNVLLLGLVILGIITGGLSKDAAIKFVTMSASILNIVTMLGSRINYNWLIFNFKAKPLDEQKENTESYSTHRFIKIAGVILNLVLTAFVYRKLISQNLQGSLTYFLAAFVILTPVFSLITIMISSPNKFKDMKRTIVVSGISVTSLLICFFLAIYISIGYGIKERISIAKMQYPGKTEDALLAYLADTTHTPRERSDIAVWTLGQIRSQKALPILIELYENDPEGKTCNHNTALCQYEIHKAIVSIEHNWLGAKEKNWFGSWARLNK